MWQFVRRGIPKDGPLRGYESYLFVRAIGYEYESWLIPVEQFWKGWGCPRGSCYLGASHPGQCVPG
ncbi:hypothetical protein FHT44_005026 [Mycolicibacterium sp. BK634]|nr:hypothetical protein [Mycolicibacterium sp. BK634]